MVVCISPVLSNADESFCSLNFASRARRVELGKVREMEAINVVQRVELY